MSSSGNAWSNSGESRSSDGWSNSTVFQLEVKKTFFKKIDDAPSTVFSVKVQSYSFGYKIFDFEAHYYKTLNQPLGCSDHL